MAAITTLESLLEMGFDRNRAERAVASTGNQGIEQAMDWLMEHENDPDIDEPFVPPAENVLGGIVEEQSTSEFADTGEGSTYFHMTLQLNNDVNSHFLKLLFLFKSFLSRQRVKDKIARDREERAQKFGGGTSFSATPTSQQSPTSPTGQGPPPTKREYDESRIQIRLLDGSTITAVFKAQEPLAAVRVYVQMNGNTPEGLDFSLLSPYPRHLYTELDMEKPLKELGLVPSAVLVVTKLKNEESSL
uniref:UBX domain protein 1 n=1 Tax=Neogobius melanostomus TaxID=47308 RepID=A0A8C6UD50_9GOBI